MLVSDLGFPLFLAAGLEARVLTRVVLGLNTASPTALIFTDNIDLPGGC